VGFALVPERGETIFVNAWNWRPTLELLRAHQILDPESIEMMGYNGGYPVSAEEAQTIAGVLDRVLAQLGTDDRVLHDLTITAEPDTFEFYRDDLARNYSASAEWLVEFRDFCRAGFGFAVS